VNKDEADSHCNPPAKIAIGFPQNQLSDGKLIQNPIFAPESN
jgi:hypothetical protein